MKLVKTGGAYPRGRFMGGGAWPAARNVGRQALAQGISLILARQPLAALFPRAHHRPPPTATLHRGQACPARPGQPSPGTPMTARRCPHPRVARQSRQHKSQTAGSALCFPSVPQSCHQSLHQQVAWSGSLCDVDTDTPIASVEGGRRGETGQDCDPRGDWPGLGWARQREARMADLAGRDQRNEPAQSPTSQSEAPQPTILPGCPWSSPAKDRRPPEIPTVGVKMVSQTRAIQAFLSRQPALASAREKRLKLFSRGLGAPTRD